MTSFVFITDTHIKSASKIRTGDFLDDVSAKLEWVVDYCNKNNCILLHGGDVFDTPSVPDMVKNRIIPILRRLNTKAYFLSGNHCLLYNSTDYNYKTSYQTLVSTGLVEDLDNRTEDLGDCIITNELPVITKGKPQVVIYHGFLNKDDGPYSFYFQNIVNVTDPVYVCLGHDHVEYEPFQFNDNIKIFRPGSFSRIVRAEESLRQPKILHIRVVEGKLQYKQVTIPVARPYQEIFNSKLTSVSKAQQHETYEEVIAQIKSANTQDMSFEEALKQVADETVSSYVMRLLMDARIQNQHKNKNL